MPDLTFSLVEQGETVETWSSPSGGTTTESTDFIVEHEAGQSPTVYEVARLVSERLTDRLGYVGTDLRVQRAESNVKVYGLEPGREATRYTATVEKEW